MRHDMILHVVLLRNSLRRVMFVLNASCGISKALALIEFNFVFWKAAL